MNVFFELISVLIPTLSTALVLGVSFAIAGIGHRKAWVLALPIVIAAWYIVEQTIVLFSPGSLLPMFWGLTLPVILSVGAWRFRRFRECRRQTLSCT